MRRQAREPGESRMKNLRFTIQDPPNATSRDQQCHTPHSALRTSHSSRGFTYTALLVAIIIIGISLGAAGKYWPNVMMREKEEELLFRGGQYRLAIERYFLATNTDTVNGTVSFARDVSNPLETGYAFANAATGVYATYSESLSIIPGYQRQFTDEWFAQDNWKVNRRLTLWSLDGKFGHAVPAFANLRGALPRARDAGRRRARR